MCVVLSEAGYFSRDDDDNSVSDSSISDDGDFVNEVQYRVGVMIGVICGIVVVMGIIIGVILKMCSRDTQVVFTDVKIIRGEKVEMVNEQYILPV